MTDTTAFLFRALLACGVGSAGILLVPQAARAVPFPHTVTVVTNTALELHLRVSGGPITEDNDDDPVILMDVLDVLPLPSRLIPPGGQWVVNVTLIPDDGAFEDDLEVEGDVFHAPLSVRDHLHRVSGDEFAFALEIDGDDLVDTAGGAPGHDGHTDQYAAFLTGIADADADEILSWTFDLRAFHVGPAPAGEPGTLALLGCSLALLARRLRRRAQGR